MKVEQRGKFGGVKVHLDANETQEFLNLLKVVDQEKIQVGNFSGCLSMPLKFGVSLAKQVHKLLIEFPNLLKDKTTEEVIKELTAEKLKSEKKLQKLGAGEGWDPQKGMKVEIPDYLKPKGTSSQAWQGKGGKE